jgi:hypothetical protein
VLLEEEALVVLVLVGRGIRFGLEGAEANARITSKQGVHSLEGTTGVRLAAKSM